MSDCAGRRLFSMLPFDVWATREGGSGRAGSVRTRAGGSQKVTPEPESLHGDFPEN